MRFGVGEAAVPVLQCPQLLRALSLGDVLAETAVSDELAGIVEHRATPLMLTQNVSPVALICPLDVRKGWCASMTAL